MDYLCFLFRSFFVGYCFPCTVFLSIIFFLLICFFCCWFLVVFVEYCALFLLWIIGLFFRLFVFCYGSLFCNVLLFFFFYGVVVRWYCFCVWSISCFVCGLLCFLLGLGYCFFGKVLVCVWIIGFVFLWISLFVDYWFLFMGYLFFLYIIGSFCGVFVFLMDYWFCCGFLFFCMGYLFFLLWIVGFVFMEYWFFVWIICFFYGLFVFLGIICFLVDYWFSHELFFL